MTVQGTISALSEKRAIDCRSGQENQQLGWRTNLHYEEMGDTQSQTKQQHMQTYNHQKDPDPVGA